MAMENQYTFLYQCGDLKGASAVCAKMKSYHTTTRHAVDQALMMVKLGLEMDNLVTAHNYANQGLESDDPAIFSCFSAAKGEFSWAVVLQLLALGSACCFLSVCLRCLDSDFSAQDWHQCDLKSTTKRHRALSPAMFRWATSFRRFSDTLFPLIAL